MGLCPARTYRLSGPCSSRTGKSVDLDDPPPLPLRRRLRAQFPSRLRPEPSASPSRRRLSQARRHRRSALVVAEASSPSVSSTAGSVAAVVSLAPVSGLCSGCPPPRRSARPQPPLPQQPEQLRRWPPHGALQATRGSANLQIGTGPATSAGVTRYAVAVLLPLAQGTTYKIRARAHARTREI
jgi:hypothetical protein